LQSSGTKQERNLKPRTNQRTIGTNRYIALIDNQFYRNIHPDRFLKKIAKSASKNKKRTIILIAAFLLLLYLLFDNKGIITRLRLEAQRREWIEKVKADSLETKRLQEQIKALEGDKRTIEKAAREKYGMAREGETVYQVKKEK
jgi:cell division protein FtsB